MFALPIFAALSFKQKLNFCIAKIFKQSITTAHLRTAHMGFESMFLKQSDE